MYRRGRVGIALSAAAALVPAVDAQAGTVALDKPCYVEQSPMTATGSGFAPGANLTLSGDGAFATAVADPAGNFSVPVQAPINPTIDPKPSSVSTYTRDVENFSDPTQNTSIQYQVVNFAADSGTSSNPRTKRTWHFSGFPTGATIYGHFRFRGRTVANYRFGKATGACGLLHAKAPGLPVSRLHVGNYTAQLDTSKHYNKDAAPRLKTTIRVFLVPR